MMGGGAGYKNRRALCIIGVGEKGRGRKRLEHTTNVAILLKVGPVYL